MSTFPAVAPPDSLGAAVALIGELSDEQFEQFANATSTPRSFSLNSKKLKELRSRVPTIGNQLPFLLGALSFLYSSMDSLGDTGSSVYPQVVARLLKDLAIRDTTDEQKALLQRRLERLLNKNPGYSRFRKVKRLQSGFIPNATSFRTMVDLRPDFGDEEQVEFRGLLKVIQFRILTDATDPAQKELVFQINEESIAEMQKALARAQKKLDLLDQQESLSSKFIEIEYE